MKGVMIMPNEKKRKMMWMMAVMMV